MKHSWNDRYKLLSLHHGFSTQKRTPPGTPGAYGDPMITLKMLNLDTRIETAVYLFPGGKNKHNQWVPRMNNYSNWERIVDDFDYFKKHIHWFDSSLNKEPQRGGLFRPTFKTKKSSRYPAGVIDGDAIIETGLELHTFKPRNKPVVKRDPVVVKDNLDNNYGSLFEEDGVSVVNGKSIIEREI